MLMWREKCAFRSRQVLGVLVVHHLLHLLHNDEQYSLRESGGRGDAVAAAKRAIIIVVLFVSISILLGRWRRGIFVVDASS